MRHTGCLRTRHFGHPGTPTTFVHATTRNWTFTRAHIRPHLSTNFGCPNMRMDSHVSGNLWAQLDDHALPRKVMGYHDMNWVSTSCPRTLWAPMMLCAHPHGRMDGHDNLWVLTHISGRTQTIVDVHVCRVVARSCVQLHAFWKPTTSPVASQIIAMDSHVKTLASTRFMGNHATLWAPTKVCAYPRAIVEAQRCSSCASTPETWATIMR